MTATPNASAQSAPTSADYTISGSGSKIQVNFNNIPFTDTDGDTLTHIQVTELPSSTGGTLKTLRTWRNRYSPVNVTANQVIYNPALASRFSQKLLYFYPSAGSSGGTFKFKVRDSSGTYSTAAYTATITVPTAPGKPAGLTVLNSTGNAVSGRLRLSWTNPNNASIAKWEVAVNDTAADDDSDSNTAVADDFGSWTVICQSTDPNSATEPYDANCKNVTAHSVNMNSLGAGSYQFKIRADNNVGSTESDPTTTITYTLAAPSTLTGVSASNGVTDTTATGATLTWTNPLDPSITEYQYKKNNTRAHDDGDTTDGDEATDYNIHWLTICQSTDNTNTTTYDADCADRTSGEVSGLSNAAKHEFQVRAVNATGGGTAATTAQVVVGTPPAKPEVSATSNSTSQLTLSWDNPNNSAIDRYQYRENNTAVDDDSDTSTPVATDFGSWTTICQSTNSGGSNYNANCASTTSHRFTVTSTGTGTNLQAGQSYQFQVRVDEKDFTGSLATVSDAVSTKAGVPARSTGLTATGGVSQATLSWTDPGDSGIDSYQYRVNDTTSHDDNDPNTAATLDYGPWQSISSSDATTTSYTVTGLRFAGSSRTHDFEVRAVDSTAGAGPASSRATATVNPLPPTPKPAKPTSFSAAAHGHRAVRLSWANPSNANIYQYRYRYKVAADESQTKKDRCGGTYGNWTIVPNSGASTTGLDVSGLCSWVKYTFQIRAVTSGGDGPASDEASATSVAAPGGTTGIGATAASTAVTLSWTNPGNPNITGYKYRYKTTGTNTWNPDWTVVASSSASTTSYRVDTLTNGTSYTFQVRAYHTTGGDGGASNEVVAVVGPPPAKPTGLTTAHDGPGRVRLSWTDPANTAITKWQYRQNNTTVDDDNDTNTSAALDYTAYLTICQSIHSGGTNYNADCDNVTGYGISGLTTGNEHKFQIRAATTPVTVKYPSVNTRHDSFGPASNAVTITPSAAPAKVQKLSAAAGDAQVALSWTDPSDSTITRYDYRYRTYNASTKQYTSWTTWATICQNTDSTQTGTYDANCATKSGYTKTGLTNGVLHEFEVRAVNSLTTGTPADPASATTLAKPAKPAVTATGGNQQVRLSWTNPLNSTITRWEYRQNDTTAHDDGDTTDNDAATDYGSWTPISDSGPFTTSHTVTGLADSRAYKLQIRAVNASGDGTPSDEASATTNPPPPSAPTGLSASAGQWSATLTWTDPSNLDITGYQYRKNDTAAHDDGDTTDNDAATDYSDWISISSSDATTTSYTENGLTAGTWKFQIRARTIGGNSPGSSEVSLRLHGPPTALAGFAASPGDQQVALSWSDPSNSNITSYQYRQNDTTAHDDGDNTDNDAATDYGSWTTICQNTDSTQTGTYDANCDDATTHTVSSLTNNRRYGFQVRALTSVWTGTTDTTGGAIAAPKYATPSLVPTTPANLTATTYPVTEKNETDSKNGTAVVLAWDAPSSGARNDNISARQYRYKSAGSYGSWTNLCTTLAESTCPSLTTYTVTGLTINTTYTFQVRAQSGTGNSGNSNEASATTAKLPKAPTGLTTTGGNEQVVLSWTIPDADPTQTGNQTDSSVTKWEYAQSTSNTTGSWTAICQNTDSAGTGYDANCASVTSHTVTGLTNNTDYWFQVRTVNPAGTRVAVTTTDGKTRPALVKGRPVPNPPAKPTGVSAAAGQRSATLTWSDPGSSDITGYEYRQNNTSAHDDGDSTDGDAATDYSGWKTICQSTNSTDTNTYNASCDDATTHTVTSLASGPWKFQLRARTPGGPSSASDEALATLHDPPAAATGFTVAPGNQQVTLTWSDPGNSDISGWQYRVNDTTADDNSDGDDDGDDDGIDDDNDGETDNDILAAHDFGAWQSASSSNATTTTVTVSSLTNYRSYGFQVRAITSVWTGTTDTTGGAIAAPKYATPSLVPTTPANLTATTYRVTEQNESDSKNGTAVVLAWDASSGSNNTNITARRYRYKSAGSYGNWTNLCTTLADSTCPSFTTYTVTGLTVNTSYTFQVRAQNPAGNSGASNEASATTAKLPKAATGLTAVGKDTEVDLSWTIPDADTAQTGHQHDTSVTSWEYAQSSGGSTGSWTIICQNTNSAGTGYDANCASVTSHTVTGLTNNTVYSYQLRSVNPAGSRLAVTIVGNRSAPASVSIRPVAAPGKPTLQSPSSIARNASAELRWTTPTNASTTVFEWQYQQNDTTNNDDNNTSTPVASDYGNWTTMCQNTNSAGTGYNADCATATSFTVTGLTNNRAYKFKIRAQNTADDDGAASDEISVTPLPPPAALSGLSAEGRDKSAVLTWSTPAADSTKATITGWQYRYKVGAGTYVPWADATSSTRTTTTHTVTGLSNNGSHTFQLRATSDSGPSAASNDAATTPLPPPAAPTVSALGRNQSVDLSWDSLNNSAVTKFQYQYKTDGSYTSWVDIPNSGAATTAHTVQYTTSSGSITTTPLSNNTAYTFKVRAVISPGPGPGAESSETAATPIALPAAPTGLTSAGSYNDATKKSQVVLTWTKPTDEALLNRIAKYQYKYLQFKGEDVLVFDWTDIPGSDKNTTAYTITGLANDDSTINSQIRVVATNKDTSIPTSLVTASTALPAPTSFSAVGRVQSVDLSWADPNHGGITKYQYRYQSSSGSCTGQLPNLVCTPATYTAWVDIPSSNNTTTSHTVRYTTSGGSVTTTPLSNGTVYPFQIRAYITLTGGGAPSLLNTAVPKAVPGKPKLLVTSSTTAGTGNIGQAALGWTGATGIVAGTTWQYRYKTASSNTWNPDWTPVPSSGYNTTGHTVTGLPNYRHYLFQVRATNSGGDGPASDATGATTGPKPTQTVTLGTLTGGDHRVTLNWTTSSASPAIALFQYRFNNPKAHDDGDTGDNDAATDYTDWADIPASNASTTTYTVTGLANGANHAFQVRAANTTGSGPASDAKSANTIPAAPAVTSVADGGTSMTLAWADPDNSSITKYQYAKNDPNNHDDSDPTTPAADDYTDWADISSSNATTTAYTATGLTATTDYTFKLRAVNASGDGDPSPPAPSTAPPATPTGLTATGSHNTTAKTSQIALAWTNPNNTAITKYQYRHKTTGAYTAWTDVPNSGAATTAHTITGLSSDDALYTAQLRAVTTSNSIDINSSPAQATARAAMPAPTSFSAVGRVQSADLTWANPNNPRITKYQYRYQTAPVSCTGGPANPVCTPATYTAWVAIASSNATTTSHTVSYTTSGGSVTTTPLSNGTVYPFQIRAHSTEAGAGAPSALDNAVPKAVPGKPKLTITPSTGTGNTAQAELVFAGSTGVVAGTTWQYRYNNTTAHDDDNTGTPAAGDYTAWTPVPSSDYNTTGHTITGLINYRHYVFQVRATNSGGDGPASDATGATTGPKPTQTVTLGTLTGGDHLVTLNWTTSSASPAIAVFQYRFNNPKAHDDGDTGDNDAATDYTDWADIPASNATTTAYTATGLANGANHAFQVRAANTTGSGPASMDKSANTIPAAPAVTSVADGGTSMTLAWADPDNSSITKYQYAKNDPNNHDDSDPTTPAADDYTDWADISSSNATTTAYTATGLTSSVSYTFKLRAVNASGDGDPSPPAPSTAPPATPTGLTATGSHNTTANKSQVALAWTDPNNTAITKYQYRHKTTGAYTAWADVPKSGAATTAHTITGLFSDDALYTAQLRAVTTSNSIDINSIPAQATARAAMPAPTSFSAVGRVQSADLTWADPNNSRITKYQYRYKKTSDTYTNWTDISDSDKDTTAHTVTSLNNGTTYPFQVRAYSTEAGGGAPSLLDTAVPKAIPGKPMLLVTPSTTSGTGTIGQAELRWTGATGIVAGTTWQYRYNNTTANDDNNTGTPAAADYTAWTPVPDSTWQSTGYTVTGLANNIVHAFQARATNSGGTGSASDAVFTTIGPKPSQKPILQDPVGGDQQITLRWTTPNANPVITKFQYRHKDNSQPTPAFGAWTDALGSTATTTSHTVTGLDNGTNYTFQVRAANHNGAGPASAEKSTETYPAAPTGLSAVGRARSIDLTWDDPGNSSITAWQYRRKTTGGFTSWLSIPNSGATTTAYTITGLTNHKDYTVELRAKNGSGNSAAATVTARPLKIPDAPANLGVTVASAMTSNSAIIPGKFDVTLSWGDPNAGLTVGNANYEEISGYQYQMTTASDTANWAPKATAWADIANTGATTTSVTLTDVAAGRTAVALRAVVPADDGASSQTAMVLTGTTTSSVARVSNTLTGTLSWTEPSDSDLIGFWQYRVRTATDHNSAYRPWSEWQTIASSDEDTTSYTVTAEAARHQYQVRAQGLNTGNASGSATVSYIPDAPANLAATATYDDPSTPVNERLRASLSWDDAGDSTINRYEYRYKIKGAADSTFTKWKTICQSTRLIIPGDPTAEPPIPPKPDPTYDANCATITAATVTGLNAGKSYTIRLRAANAVSLSTVATVDVDPTSESNVDLVPATPSGVTNTRTLTTMSVSWTNPNNMTIDYYEYCDRYTASTDAPAGACTWKKIPNSGYNTTSHTLKPLIAGRHLVQIRAVNTSGHSNPSGQINAIYVAPTAAIARPVTDGPRSPLTSFTITFSHPIATDTAGTLYTNSTIDNAITLRFGSATGTAIPFDATIAEDNKTITVDLSSVVYAGKIYAAATGWHYGSITPLVAGPAHSTVFSVLPPNPPPQSLVSAPLLSVPPATDTEFYSGTIDSPVYCSNLSQGGPTTYPVDTDGDGVADACALPFTTREATARQVTFNALIHQYPVSFAVALQQACESIADQSFNDDPDNLAQDACATGDATTPDLTPTETDSAFYTGVITGPGYCAQLSLGGPTTYPADTDGDGVADTCTQPFTAREATARQIAYNALANQYEVFYRIFLEQSCGHITDQTFNDKPENLATDACAYF